MIRCTQSFSMVAITSFAALASHTALAQTVDPATCSALKNRNTPALQITEAALQAGGELAPDANTAITGATPNPQVVPAHCLVRGTIAPRKGVGGASYGIGFEMRLPVTWNGKFLFQGGGGTDGFVAPALGSVPSKGSKAVPALRRGYAVVSSNGGHQGLDASFGLDQQARIDFAYAQIGQTTQTAKSLLQQLYGRAPDKSVFMGCSNGGREAMIAAQRYPTEFDGVVAGNAGFHLSRAAIAEAWDSQQLVKAAPKDAQGKPILSQAFSNEDLALVSTAVRQQCDAKDGLSDGILNAWESCDFKPESLQCAADNKTNACLSSVQVTALKAVFGGPKNSAGEALYSDWPYDTGIDGTNWRQWKLGTSSTAQANALNLTLGAGSLKSYFMTPPDPAFDPLSFDFDRDVSRVDQTGALNDAISTFMTTFRDRGSKLIIFHGVSDPVFSANDIKKWYARLNEDASGGDWKETGAFARLFMVPGMNHCGGGPALDDFDPLTALETWMDQGTAPERIVAQGQAFPGRTQPLCPYPQTAQYQGGDGEKAQSFICR